MRRWSWSVQAFAAVLSVHHLCPGQQILRRGWVLMHFALTTPFIRTHFLAKHGQEGGPQERNGCWGRRMIGSTSPWTLTTETIGSIRFQLPSGIHRQARLSGMRCDGPSVVLNLLLMREGMLFGTCMRRDWTFCARNETFKWIFATGLEIDRRSECNTLYWLVRQPPDFIGQCIISMHCLARCMGYLMSMITESGISRARSWQIGAGRLALSPMMIFFFAASIITNPDTDRRHFLANLLVNKCSKQMLYGVFGGALIWVFPPPCLWSFHVIDCVCEFVLIEIKLIVHQNGSLC